MNEDHTPAISQPKYPQTNSLNSNKIVEQRKKSRLPKILLISVLFLIFVFILVIVLLRIFLFEAYGVNGPSMGPTIKSGQVVLVLKSRSDLKINTIVIFSESGLARFGQKNTKPLIKRIVALPGNRVEINEGKLTVFNSAHPEGFDPDTSDGLSREYTSGNMNLVVPSSEVFVLGDNRSDSLDSRDFGPIPIAHIIGRVIDIQPSK